MAKEEVLLQLVQELEGHTDRVWSLAWNPKSTRNHSILASCSGDQTVRIWEGGTALFSCQVILDERHTRTIRSCDWSPDGKYLATASFDGTVGIWERLAADDYDNIATLEGHESEVKSVAWNPSGSLIATCSRDKSVWIWEHQPGNEFECVSVLNRHTQDVKMVLWHPTREILVSASYDDTIRVWALEPDGDDWLCVQTLDEVNLGHTSTVWQISFDATGDRMVSCSDDLQLIVWDTSSDPLQKGWKHLCTISGYHSRTIYSVHWSTVNGSIASGAADDCIRIFSESKESSQPGFASYSIATSVEKAHSNDVNCVRWHPHDDVVASAGDDNLVKLWRLV